MPLEKPTRIKLVDFNGFVKSNKVKYVKDPFIFDGSSKDPAPEGLTSPDIFGDSLDDKRKRMGAIRLDTHYLHPLIYSRVFKRSWRKIDQLIAGESWFIVNDKGILQEVDSDDDRGQSGIEFFYDNYDKFSVSNLDIKEKDSILLKQLKAVAKKPKQELFTNKWLVVPLLFRDVMEGDDGHMSLDILNEKYKRLISLTKIVNDSGSNPLFDKKQVQLKIQLQLTEIFDHLMDKSLKGKDSVIKRDVLSKNIDYTSRLVMSAPSFKSEKIGGSPINLDTCGIPLSASADMFAPFVINHMYKLLVSYHEQGKIQCDMDTFEEYFNKQNLHDIINTYVESWDERLDPLVVPGTENTHIYMEGQQKIDGEWEEFKRPMTVLDLIYQATYTSVEINKKHNMFTRYPVMDVFNVVTAKIHVLSTDKTRATKINDFEFEYYPYVDYILEDEELLGDVELYEEKISSIFDETMNISNLMLEGLDGSVEPCIMAT